MADEKLWKIHDKSQDGHGVNEDWGFLVKLHVWLRFIGLSYVINMDFLHQWRHWIRPFIISLYFVLLIIALPLCVVELHQNGAARHVEAWFTGGIFVMMAIPISLWGILQHLVNYTQPNLQRHIIRYTYQAHCHTKISTVQQMYVILSFSYAITIVMIRP